MLISKTPLRISLFGGGTDYSAHFRHNYAGVIGGAINKYIYTSIIPLSSISEQRFKISYRDVENVNCVGQISHDVIREVLKFFPDLSYLNISTNSDLPGGSGLGSSSSFTVGLINLLYYFQGLKISRKELFDRAVHLERNILKETGGIQDQLFATYGGLNFYDLSHAKIDSNRLNLSSKKLKTLNDSISLVFTSKFRKASSTLAEQSSRNAAGLNKSALVEMHNLTINALQVFNKKSDDLDLKEIGRLLTETWILKRELSNSIENNAIAEIIEYGLGIGAFGAKLLGAGDGGFVLFLANKKTKDLLKRKFQNNFIGNIRFQPNGTSIAVV